MRKRLVVPLIAAAALAVASALGPMTGTAGAASSAGTLIGGILQPGFATTAPTTLQVLTPKRGMFTVNVSSSTPIVRRYNGASALDELSPGDYVQVAGDMGSNNTVSATLVKDYTIQHAYTHNLGVITAISSDATQLTVRELADFALPSQQPFRPGETIIVRITPMMTVTLSDGTIGTAADSLSVGATIASVGVFNRSWSGPDARTLTAWRVRVLSAVAGQTAVVAGILQQAPTSTTAPASLTLQTAHGPVTVNVLTTTAIIRRYNGASSLAELSAGDHVAVGGIYKGNATYDAKLVKDISIQNAYTFVIARITSIQGSTVTVSVVAKGSHKSPFTAGQIIPLNTGTSTAFTMQNGSTGAVSNLQLNMRVYVLGVYNRVARAFTQVFRIRVIS